MILLEVGNLDGLVFMMVAIWFGPPLLLSLIGLSIYGRNKKTAKVLFILALVYVVVGGGICGSLVG